MSVVSVVCVWKMCGMCLEGFRKVSASGLRVSGPDRPSQDRIHQRQIKFDSGVGQTC